MGGHVPDFGTISLYSEKELSLIHKWSPWTKFLFFIIFIIAVILIDSLLFLFAMYLFAFAFYWIGNLPKKNLFKWYLFPVFFVVTIAILFVFNEPGHGLLGVEFLGFTVQLTDSGIFLLAMFILRTLSIVTLSLAFVMTTKYSHISYIVQRILPYPISSIFLLSYRFSFVVFVNISTMLKALHSRMGGLVKGFFKQSRLYGGVIALSLIHSIEKAERIGKAMEARGYSGKLRTYEVVKYPSLFGWFTLLVFILLLILVYFYQEVLP